jgi:hypothetical protein
MIFFHTNDEHRIGWKKLSRADLGISDKSQQTHIGLYEDVLTFLDDSDVVKSAMLMYDDYCDIHNCTFDRIQNPDGTFRSPKIRVGDSADSVVSKIREFASTDSSAVWYLIWVGLDSDELVFWLVKSGSADYRAAQHIIFDAPRVIKPYYEDFNAAVELIENRINDVSSNLQQDLALASQTKAPQRNYRPLDLDNAERLFKATGREGETLVYEYLDRKKAEKAISSFLWMNKNRESGDPFDFIINENLSTEMYIDVKSTRFAFNQKVVFSSQEVSFIDSLCQDSKYSVYRVYDLRKLNKMLCICNGCTSYMSNLNRDIQNLKNTTIQYGTRMTTATLAMNPHSCFPFIGDPIVIKSE